MESARPWEVGDEYWDFADFVGWLKENEHLIEQNLTNKNDMSHHEKQGILYLPPQKDEIIIIDAPQGNYYYWINMEDNFQHLVLSSSLPTHKRTKPLLPRNSRPSLQWLQAERHKGTHHYYRVKISDLSPRIPFINWNQSPWRDVK